MGTQIICLYPPSMLSFVKAIIGPPATGPLASTNYGFIIYTNYGFIMYTQVRMTKYIHNINTNNVDPLDPLRSEPSAAITLQTAAG